MLRVVPFSSVSQGSVYSPVAPWAPMLFRSLCQVMVLRWSSYQSCPWRWALLCDFLCSVPQRQLARGCVSLWDSLQGFLMWQLLHKEDAKLLWCASLSASHLQAVRASLRLQQSHKWVRQLRCAADGSFPCWLFHPSEAVLQRSF